MRAVMAPFPHRHAEVPRPRCAAPQGWAQPCKRQQYGCSVCLRSDALLRQPAPRSESMFRPRCVVTEVTTWQRWASLQEKRVAEAALHGASVLARRSRESWGIRWKWRTGGIARESGVPRGTLMIETVGAEAEQAELWAGSVEPRETQGGRADLLWTRFRANMSRITGLMKLALSQNDPLGPMKLFFLQSDGPRADILRTIVVFLHATFEDVLRTTARQRIVAAKADVLNEIPLVGAARSDRREKFSLGSLDPHRRCRFSRARDPRFSQACPPRMWHT